MQNHRLEDEICINKSEIIGAKGYCYDIESKNKIVTPISIPSNPSNTRVRQSAEKSIDTTDSIFLEKKLIPSEEVLVDVIEKTLINVEASRKSVGGLLLFIIVLLLAAGIVAFIPIEGTVVAPAKVVAYGISKSVRTEEGGLIREVMVRVGDKVRRGTPLIRIERPLNQDISIFRTKLSDLRLKEARLMALMRGKNHSTSTEKMTVDILNADDMDQTSPHSPGIPKGFKEGLTITDNLRRSIDREMKEISRIEDKRSALWVRISKVRKRMNDTKALQGRGVVYNDGVYTQQLYGSLQSTANNLRRDIKRTDDLLKSSRERLARYHGELEQHRNQRNLHLQTELGQVQQNIADIQTKLDTLKADNSEIEIQATDDGVIVKLLSPSIDKIVPPNTELMILRTAGRKALLEASLSVGNSEQVQVGQQVTASFYRSLDGTRFYYGGFVKSYTRSPGAEDSETDMASILIEVDAPDIIGDQELTFAPETKAEVSITSRSQPIWRYLSVALDFL